MDNYKFSDPTDNSETQQMNSSDTVNLNLEDYLAREQSSLEEDIESDEQQVTLEGTDLNDLEISLSNLGNDESSVYNPNDIETPQLQGVSNEVQSTPEESTMSESYEEQILNSGNDIEALIGETQHTANTSRAVNQPVSPAQQACNSSEDDNDFTLPRKAQIGIVIGIIILLGLICTKYFLNNVDLSHIGSEAKSTDAEQTSSYIPESTQQIAHLDNIVVSKQLYTTNIVGSKRIIFTSGFMQFQIFGISAKDNLEIIIPISSEEFNQFVDGDIVKVQYNLVKINNATYVCNQKILEVIH